MRLKPIILALLLPAVSSAALAQEANLKPPPDRQWWKPIEGYADVLAGKSVYLYDSDTSMKGLGFRAGLKWPIPMMPDAMKWRVGYFQLPTAEYDFPIYQEGNKHTAIRLDDIFDVMGGNPVRDGNRTKAGFPGWAHKEKWKSKGLEFGPEVSLTFQNYWAFAARVSLVYDMSKPPELEGFAIEDAKLKRRTSIAWGLSLMKRVSDSVDVGINYDRYVLNSSVTGKPQAWNEMQGEYLFGRRSYDIFGLSANYRWK